jgi:hypothetical protein
VNRFTRGDVVARKIARHRKRERAADVQNLHYVWANKPVKPPGKEKKVENFKELKTFCSELLGTEPGAPLKDANGATIGALVEAFVKLKRLDEPKQATLTAQSFEDGIYREPWSCYVIRNSATGVSYVGIAEHGFVQRYDGGRWWEGHHNARLTQDVLVFGLVSFRVHIYVCADETDMRRQEAALITANRLYTYNVRNEADSR